MASFQVLLILMALLSQFCPGAGRFYFNFLKSCYIHICFVAGNDEHTKEDIKAAMAEIEKELHSAVDKFWGKKCVLSVQCSHFYIDNHLVQVASCDKGTGYTGWDIISLYFFF